jgi:outer membrane receptor for monomeric catechols
MCWAGYTDMEHMPAAMLRTVTIAVVAIGLCGGACAADGARPRHTPVHGSALSRSEAMPRTTLHATSRKQKAVSTLAADRDPYADPAAPYKADRLSWPREGQPMLNIPGQVTVLTRQILDDRNATSLKDALSSTAGVTVGR